MSLPFEGDGVSEVIDVLRKIEVYVRSANEQLERQTSNGMIDLLKTSKLVQGPPLRSHQLEGMRWILDLYKNGLNGILADEMGLGKTAQVIASMALMAENGSPGPFLVVVPLSLLHSWSEQLQTFAPDIPHILYYGSSIERTENAILDNLDETLAEVISKKRFCPSKELSRIRKNFENYSLEYRQAIQALTAPESLKDIKKKCAKPKKLKIPTTSYGHESNPEYLANLDKVIDNVLSGTDEFSTPIRFDSLFSSKFDENCASSSTSSDLNDDSSISKKFCGCHFSTAHQESKLSMMAAFDQNKSNIQCRDCVNVSCKSECGSQINVGSKVYPDVSIKNLYSHSVDSSFAITGVLNAENNVKTKCSASLMQPLHSQVQPGIESDSADQVGMLPIQASQTFTDQYYSVPSSSIQKFQDFEKGGNKEFHTNESIDNFAVIADGVPESIPKSPLDHPTTRSYTKERGIFTDKCQDMSLFVSQVSMSIDQAHHDHETGVERGRNIILLTRKAEDLSELKDTRIKLFENQKVQFRPVQSGISSSDVLSFPQNGYIAEVNAQEKIANSLTDNTADISKGISIGSLNPILSLDSNKSPSEIGPNGETDKLLSQGVFTEDISQDQCQGSREVIDYGPEISTNLKKEEMCPSGFYSGAEGFSTLSNNFSLVNSNETIGQKGEEKSTYVHTLSNDRLDIRAKSKGNKMESSNETSITDEDQIGSLTNGLRKDILPVVITTYEVAIRDCSFLNRISFKAMIVDEAQRIKGAASKLYQCLQTYDAEVRLVVTGTPLQNSISELWRLLHFLLPEIFPIVADFAKWFDPGSLMDQMGRDRLAVQEAENALVTNLRNIIHPFMLRRTKAQVDFKLPPKKEIILRVLMTPDQQKLHDYVVQTLLERGSIASPTKHSIGSITTIDKNNILKEGYKRRAAYDQCHYDERDSASSRNERLLVPKKRGRPSKIKSNPRPVENNSPPRPTQPSKPPYKFLKSAESSSKLMLLRRLANHSYLVLEHPDSLNLSKECDRSEEGKQGFVDELLRMGGKLALLDRLLKKLIAENHKTLIFSQFTMVLDVIEDLLLARGWNWVRLDGAVRFETRKEVIHEFNTSGAELPIFLLSTRSGGLGLNLQASADTVIIHDSDWNPQLDLQAMDRCHRLGQEKPVLVLRFLTVNSIEEHIYSRALAKRGLEQLLLHDKLKSPTSTMEVDYQNDDHTSKGDLEEEIDFRELLNNPTTAKESTVDALNLTDGEIDKILNRDFEQEVSETKNSNDCQMIYDESNESINSKQIETVGLDTSKFVERDVLPNSDELGRKRNFCVIDTSNESNLRFRPDFKTSEECGISTERLAKSRGKPDSSLERIKKFNEADQSNLKFMKNHPDTLKRRKLARLGLGRSSGTFKTPFKRLLKGEE
nr:lymphoid specific helicase [Hymenolepis microstoma]